MRALWQYQQAVLAQALEAKVRASVPPPTAAEVEAFFAQRAADFANPMRRACDHILFESRGEAAAARKRLARGEKFEELARAESIDKASGRKGGALGEIPDDRLEAMMKSGSEAALARALRETAPGEVSQPVGSGLGFHLVRCGPRIPAAPRPLAEVREAVSGRVAEERERRAAQELAAQLRAAAHPQVDREALVRAAVPRS
jgi:peptidyl-prolyl cis-trans isomerase C